MLNLKLAFYKKLRITLENFIKVSILVLRIKF